MCEDFRWDKDGRYKRIARAFVKQCAGESLTVEEAKFVFEIAKGEISEQGNHAVVSPEDILQNYRTDDHKQ